MKWRLHTSAPAWTEAGWAKVEEARFDDKGRMEAVILGLDTDNQRLVLRPDEICPPLFFGVAGDGSGGAGHYLYSSDGRSLVYQLETGFFDHPSDGQMQPRSTRSQGSALLTHFKTASQTPWTILSMWDYSGDSRGGSNSTFFFGGEHDKAGMIELAHRFFPTEVDRIERTGAIEVVGR